MKGKPRGKRKTQVDWYPAELKILRESYRKCTRAEIQALIPRHTLSAIEARAFLFGLRKGRFEYRIRPTVSDPMLLAIFDRMKESNITTADLAAEIGGSPATFAYWADGTHDPKLKTLRRVLDYFGLDIKLVERA